MTAGRLPESWNRRMAAMPDAPAWRQVEAFSAVMPPMAKTGMATARQTSVRRVRPCGGPCSTLEGVAKTGPKKM